MNRILRLPRVIDVLGLKKSAIYQGIERGEFPPPISLGPRAVGWVESEINSIIKARIAGQSDDELRKLVAILVDKRQHIAASRDVA